MKFDTIIQATEYFADKQRCIATIRHMRWGDGPVICYFCGNDKCYELKGATKRFKCAGCRKQFSITKGTIFESSPMPLQKWFVGIWLVTQHKKGISSVQLATDLGIGQKAAWFMGHRIRGCFAMKDTPKMSGIVQVDETYVGGKNKNRHWEKQKPKTQGRSSEDKTLVIGAMGMKGSVRVEVAQDASAATLLPFIYANTAPNAIVVSDEWKGYSQVETINPHVRLSHKQGEHSRGVFDLNRLEGFWGLFKRGIFGIYHWVSPKHLQRYCDEFSFRYNALAMCPADRFRGSFAGVHNRLSYATLIEGKKYGRKPKSD